MISYDHEMIAYHIDKKNDKHDMTTNLKTFICDMLKKFYDAFKEYNTYKTFFIALYNI